MKRYSLTIDMNMDGELKVRTYVSDQGEWVRWSDIEKLRSKLIEEFSVNVANGKKAWIKKLFSSFENIK